MDLNKIILICKAYDKLGWAVQAQLDDLMGGETAKQNPNAIKLIEKFGRSLPDEAKDDLAALVADFHAAHEADTE